MTSTTMDAANWADSKKYLWLLGAPVMLLPIIGYGFYTLTGWGVFWWFAPLFLYLIIPIADFVIGEDRSNPPEAAVPRLEKERYYRYATYLAVPLQYLSLLWGCWAVATLDLAWWAYLGAAVSVGIVSGVSINTGHELGHKTDGFEQWLAKIALATSAYGHFFVEHNRGHHVRVATPEDPASSRMGESFYAFLPRTVIGSLRSAWEIEARRLERNGHGVWSIHNHNLQAWAMTVVLFTGLTAWFGWIVLPFLLIQAVYGFSLLEVVNYLEHYGLRRQKLDSGRYERCQPRHSWNNNHTVTNLLLYQLQRHSDHHANPTRSYQALRHFDEAPQLPTGYAGMITLAYVPWLWYRVMDPKVVTHHDGDLSKAALQPGKEARLMARYGTA
ncbi:alkane 1-monooxygenase [Algiphilus sp.]|uniref:alkane 1-monooxygenase n=1 Tax=Algiphilus sp. TaxID=1872431 RepID=UPI0025C4DFA5|nr:alkane 1-monooxygenase [Algiphilus sp.]